MGSRFGTAAAALGLAIAARPLPAQAPAPPREGTPARTMSIEEYEPKSTLVVPQHPVALAKYPFIDVHNHQDTDMSEQDAATLVREMDGINLQIMVNLSGGQGDELVRGVKNLKGR